MIIKLINGIGASFGKGTTRIHSYMTKTKSRGQIKLSSCWPVEEDGKIVEFENSKKIILEFSTTESIDILIQKLNDLKDLMEEANYG